MKYHLKRSHLSKIHKINQTNHQLRLLLCQIYMINKMEYLLKIFNLSKIHKINQTKLQLRLLQLPIYMMKLQKSPKLSQMYQCLSQNSILLAKMTKLVVKNDIRLM